MGQLQLQLHVVNSIALLTSQCGATEDSWVKFATLLLGLGVAVIAWRQWKVARAAHRLNLFSHRLAVRNALHEWLTQAALHPRTRNDDAFETSLGEATWLFPENISETIKREGWLDDAHELSAIQAAAMYPNSPGYIDRSKEAGNLKKRLLDKRTWLDNAMRKHLTITE